MSDEITLLQLAKLAEKWGATFTPGELRDIEERDDEEVQP